jgi:hypothetical protein
MTEGPIDQDTPQLADGGSEMAEARSPPSITYVFYHKFCRC